MARPPKWDEYFYCAEITVYMCKAYKISGSVRLQRQSPNYILKACYSHITAEEKIEICNAGFNTKILIIAFNKIY